MPTPWALGHQISRWSPRAGFEMAYTKADNSCGRALGSTSGVAEGLAALDPALVPYGAMTAIIYTTPYHSKQ
jgi:hypothetical protein